MLEELVALIAPPRCAICGRGCRARQRLCDGCDGALRSLGPITSAVPGIDLTWSAAPYDGAARDLVAALKFGARVGLADDAAAIIAERAPAEVLLGSIVPVPAAPGRRRQRGFDSAEAIAAAIAKRAGVPIAPCLARAQGPRQVGRHRGERLAEPPRIRLLSPAPRDAVLVDDVVTTGATLGACARALRSAGAARLVAVTLAASKTTRGRLGMKASWA
jgi:predicted amidophosphoribosyltransferase